VNALLTALWDVVAVLAVVGVTQLLMGHHRAD
jgi:L-alanine-DL-glutamate epimerase-like enolase superfamily enzyme